MCVKMSGWVVKEMMSVMHSCVFFLVLATTVRVSHQIRDTHTFSAYHHPENVTTTSTKTGSEPPKSDQVFASTSPAKHIQRRYPAVADASDVQLDIQDDHVVMDNGIVQVTLSKPEGAVTGIQYMGIPNLLEIHNEQDNRGYWDLDWSKPEQDHNGVHDRISGTNFTVIADDSDQVEISFIRTWHPSVGYNSVPLNIDIRFVMLRGCPGLYSYAIYEHLNEWPDFDLHQTRIVFKLNKDMFHYMAISDDRQRIMPMPEDRDTGQILAYKEAVRLTNPTNPQLNGEVDDKYQYACENKDCKVHGWISTYPSIGFWTIIPSNEFQSNGPLKQDLTSHVGPTTLSMFHSLHYSGDDVVIKFRDGEYWKKVLGPVFFYFNALDDEEEDPYSPLWDDAKQQMMIEVQSWPYSFPASEDYPYSEERGAVTGRLLVKDRYISEDYILAGSAYVGLALPGDVGSWQREGKGYQFWTTTEANGCFSINNIRSGDYNLYAYVPGFIGDYKYDVNITITAGCDIDMGDLVYEPPRDGPTLWEIGIADRSAAEFYVPDPEPNYINKLYLNHPESEGKPSTSVQKFRQYGLWERYTELYPYGDIIYVVDVSDYSIDWFYAHVTRKDINNTYHATTWQIVFILDNVDDNKGNYILRLALASATVSSLHVRVNDPKADPPLFSTGLIGKDNAIARHGIHGLYWLYNIQIPSNLLTQGFNTIYLTQSRNSSPFQGVMYDYIRLEGPWT